MDHIPKTCPLAEFVVLPFKKDLREGNQGVSQTGGFTIFLERSWMCPGRFRDTFLVGPLNYNAEKQEEDNKGQVEKIQENLGKT